MADSAERDNELARRLQVGDEQALVDLMARFKAPLFSYVFRIVGRTSDAEDIAQETFVRAFTRAGTYNPRRATLSTWLFQIARNLSIDTLRSRSRADVQSLDDHTGEVPSVGNDPAGEVAAGETQRAVASAVADLPEDQRTAFVLAEYEGLSYREIAAVMKSTEKSVETRIYRAKRSLRTVLSRYLKDSP